MNTNQSITNQFSTFCLFFLNQEGEIIEGNLAGRKLLQLSEKDLFPKNFFSKLVKNGLTSGETWFTVNESTKFYGSFELSQNADSKGYVLLIKDLTEKQNRAETHEKFFSLSLDMLCVAGMDGYFKKLNPAFQQTLGFTEQELCTKPVTDFIHPDDIQKTNDEIEHQRKGSQVWSFENRYRTKEGKYKWLSWKSIPYDGYMYAVARDISNIKETQEQIVRLNSDLVKLNAELEDRVKARTHELTQSQKITAILQERTEAILKIAPVTLWSIDTKGIFQFYEGRGLTTLPESKEKQVGKNIFEAASPYPDLSAAVTEALSGKAAEAISQINDGYFKTRINPQFDKDQKVIGAVGVTIDVTAEIKQDVERRKWEEIFERAPWGIAIATAEHKVASVNPAFLQMHGGKAEDWIGAPAGKMYASDQIDGHKARAKDLFKEGRLHFESDHMNADGKSFPVDTDISLIRDEAGKPLYVVGNFFDLSEKRKADNEIRIEQEKLRKLISANIIGIAFWDSSGAIDANDAYLNMLGYTREEMKNGALNQKNLIPEEWRETNKKRIEEFYATGAISPYELEHLRKDGTRVPVLIATVRLTETSGISWILDLTQQKKMQNEARQAEVREKAALEASKLKSTFLANMSHEIRTPINGVVGMTHLLKDTALNDEQKDLCDNIARSAESLLSVINDVLDFSKVEAGKLEIENVVFDLNDMVTETVRTMTFAAQKKALVLRLEYENPLGNMVISDPGRIRQVLNNLLSNAIKFTSVGFITLRVKASEFGDKAKLRFEVQDTGIGISKETQTKLFTPFSQADSSTTRRYGGSGLGLSISKGLVDLLNGDIGIVSEQGRGSTFWFSVDVSIAKNAPAKKSHEPKFADKTKFKNVYILVAEDNQINQIVAVKMLQKMGYKPQAVANGHEVLKAIRERDFDLILMDCQMPEMDGYETTKALRELPESKHNSVPVIAMTANAVAGDKEKCLAAGMNDYISKPVEPDLLFAVVEKWLSHRHPNL